MLYLGFISTKKRMIKLVILLSLSFSVFSQDSTEYTESFNTPKYASLNESKVYDVEIIVFAYNSPLPNYTTFDNKAMFDDSKSIELLTKPQNSPFTKSIEVTQSDEKSLEQKQPELTVSLQEDTNKIEALAWFEHDLEHYKLTNLWKKLSKHANITPLIHKAWRQTETEFSNPIYVKISNIDDNLIPNVNTGSDLNPTQEFIFPDLSLNGMVALSKGRYMHFGHSLNLIRTYKDVDNEDKNMIFSLNERRQLKTDKLNYFDSPWIGSIVKITEFTGELNNEE